MIPPPTEISQKSSEEISITKVENKQPSEEQSEPNVSESELPNLEEVTPKMSEVKLEDESKEVPLPPTASDEEEFHEASESVSQLGFLFRLNIINRKPNNESYDWGNDKQ